MPRIAGACTLWPLFQVLAQPQTPLRMRLKQVGRGTETVEALAVSAQVIAPSFERPALMQAHMLLLPDRPEADTESVPLREVGVNCRICSLASCVARREPSIISDGF
jgi:hypothetical protein